MTSFYTSNDEELINKISLYYPIGKLLFYDDDIILKNCNKYKINYYEKKSSFVSDNDTELLVILNSLVILIDSLNTKTQKCIIICIIYKLLIDNYTILLSQPILLVAIKEKINEFKNMYYDEFEKIKIITDDINPIDIIIQIIDQIEKGINIFDQIKKNNCIDFFVGKTFDELLDISVLSKNHLILLNNDNIKFNFKVINTYSITEIQHIIYTLSKNTELDIITIMLTIYEIFINNVDVIRKHLELTKKIKTFMQTEMLPKFSNFNKYSKYNNNINPIITINSLINFYF